MRSLAVFLLIWSNLIFAQTGQEKKKEKKYQFREKPVVVTASRIPGTYQKIIRTLSIITAEEIRKLPVNSVAELLNYVAGTELRLRNPMGIQADAAIRGSSFEQVLILVDGVKANDPQTGHHSLNLPVSLQDIERIEVLRGPASSLYGPNAFAGVINIITRTSSRDRSTNFSTTYGSFNTYSVGFSFSFSTGKMKSYLSLTRSHSDGYRPDTDFDLLNIFASSRLQFGQSWVDLKFGSSGKDFGAYHFYAPFPSYEETRASFITAAIKAPIFRTGFFQTTLFYRRHKDRFVLLREEPDFYTNNHLTTRTGAEMNIRLFCLAGEMVTGLEIYRETIDSTGIRNGAVKPALGSHLRDNAALFIEYQRIFKVVLLNVGGRIDYNSQFGSFFSPSLSLGLLLTENLNIKTALARSFRAPTFTELYYSSPANQGDPELKPEQAWSWEFGVDYNFSRASFTTTAFLRFGQNLIDWAKPENRIDIPWKAMNLHKVLARGMEFQFSFNPFPSTKLKGSYTFLRMETEKKDNYLSKYVLNYPEHEAKLMLLQTLPAETQLSITVLFRKRVQTGSYMLLNARISKRISSFTFALQGINLLNRKYCDIPGVEMPGRWITLSMEMGF